MSSHGRRSHASGILERFGGGSGYAESCTVQKPVPGVYNVMIHATAAYTKGSVHGTYTPK